MSNNSPEADGTTREHDKVLCLDLHLKDITIRLESSHEVPPENFEELTDYVTGMRIERASEATSPDGKLIYTVAEDIEVQYMEKKRELRLQGPSRLFGSGSTLAYMAQYMSECFRATKTGMLLIHAAAVKSAERNVSYVILGEKGAGKTTLALRLCHQYGYQLIGNDQIFLGPDANGNLITDGGNPWFNVRQTALKSDPYLSQLLPQPAATEKPAWNNKFQVDPYAIGVKADQERAAVGSIFHIRIDHTQPNLQVARWEGLQRNLLLHERFGRHISGQATPLQDDKGHYLGSLPLLEPNRAFRARDELVRLVLRMGIVEVFAPNATLVADFIHRGEP